MLLRVDAAATETAGEASREVADAHVAIALLNAIFLFVGVLYGARVLKSLPKTYLSEIAFPLDFCVKLLACVTLFSTHTLQWVVSESVRVWRVSHSDVGSTNKERIDSSEVLTMSEALVWGMASTVLWMEYRRSLTPSAYLRTFWLVKWISAVFTLVVLESFVSHESPPATLTRVVSGVQFVAISVLALLCFVRPTPIEIDLVSFPPDVLSPTALLHSQSTALRRLSNLSTNYGSLRDVDWNQFRKGGVHEPTDAAAKLRNGSTDQLHADRHGEHSASTRSSVVGVAAAIAVTIPSSTTSIWGKHEFVTYKIVVQTEDDAWTVRRHYNDFVALHDELPDEIRDVCALPLNLESTTQRHKFLSWRGRPRSMKTQLESYLRNVLSHPALEPSASHGLCDFLEMEYVDDVLSRSFHSAPRI